MLAGVRARGTGWEGHERLDKPGVGIHRLRYSWVEPVLDSPFPVFCRSLALAVQFWMITEPPDCSQTVAAHV